MSWRPRRVALVAALVAVLLSGCSGLAPASVTLSEQGSSSVTVPPAAVIHPESRPSLTVVGLGDSVTAGTACDCEDFVSRFGSLAGRRTGEAVTADNDGISGLTSAELAAQLQREGSLRQDVRKGDIVLITIGANDLSDALQSWADDSACDDTCAAAALPEVTANIEQIVSTVHALRTGQPTQVVVTNYWNVFADGAVAQNRYSTGYLTWSDHVTRLANAAICAAADHAGALCLDLYQPFKGDGTSDPTPLLASDGDHPNAKGHQLIAETIAAELLA
jgi:lysophospholipase L1-like esterase